MGGKLGHGTFTISLDFEIHWGVSEHRTIENYSENLRNVSVVVDKLLDNFLDYNIHATWATVGMLLCKNRDELVNCVELNHRPIYANKKLSNYRLLDKIGNNENEDPYHYAGSLVNKINKVIGQEIGTHTFSHYYCLENGPTPNHFHIDLDAAIAMSKKNGIKTKSIVFPRNQYSPIHLDIVRNRNIYIYRGNEKHWMYAPRSRADETLLRKVARFLDSYIKLSGDNTYELQNKIPLNIPSSRFLRPYNPKFKILDSLRLKRILSEMKYAAKHNRLYHLWWHPHNFGKHMDENFAFLKKILSHYTSLEEEYGFRSLNMSEVGKLVNGNA